MTSTIVPLGTYRNETPYPFCPGCGHGTILDHLNGALVDLCLDPAQVVIVTDIGCAGLSDQYFATSAFHGLHGRSLTYATGIKLARPELHVIVVMGDGGTGIGGAHFLTAARRNIGLTLLVFNNFNFGMTGGQHSTTTPTGSVTSTTPGGNPERPLDICATAAVNGAAYVYRGTSFDDDLSVRIAEAIVTPGFAVLDIWELCTAYFVPSNKFGKRSLEATQRDMGLATGVIERRSVADYAAAVREGAASVGSGELEQQVEPMFAPGVDRPVRIVVAGSAGGKVQSAVRLAGEAAIACGLHATQRNDYPVTVKTGHSVAELIIGPDPIDYTGIDRPDALVILSTDGLRKAAAYLPRMDPADRVFLAPQVPAVATAATVEVIDPATLGLRVARTDLALTLLVVALERLAAIPAAALEEAARAGPSHTVTNLNAIEQGRRLAGV